MYASQYTEWDASKMGPHRDIIEELSESIRNRGLHFGVSSHRAENWWFFGEGRKIPSDVQDDRFRALYGPAMGRESSENGRTPPDKAFLDDWLLRTVELVDRFHPDVLWFDWWIARPEFCDHLQTFSAYYYNQGSRITSYNVCYTKLLRYKFKVPDAWKSREVKLVFEGVMTDAEVRVNGQLIGPVHQGAFYEFKYLVTDKLKFGEENVSYNFV